MRQNIVRLGAAGGTVWSASCLNSQRVRPAEASRIISGATGVRGCCELGQLALRSGRPPLGREHFFAKRTQKHANRMILYPRF